MSTRLRVLSDDDVRAIRKRLGQTLLGVSDAFGADDPVDSAKLASAVSRQTTGFGGTQKYKTVAELAATLIYGIAMNHSFENGNKRTALVCGLVLLDKNRHILVNTTERELFHVVTTLVRHELPLPAGARRDSDAEVAALAGWLAARTRATQLGDRALKFSELKSILTDLGCTFDKPYKNFIKIHRAAYMVKIGFPKHQFDVDVNQIKKIRRALKLDEVHGYDGAAFYDLGGRVGAFVNTYRNLMQWLADA